MEAAPLWRGIIPVIHILELPENFGFCKAVNEGIRAAKAPYVLLLNNDTEAEENFVEEMLEALKRHKNAFSCGARMVQYHDRDRLDDAEISTARWDISMPGEKGKIFILMKRRTDLRFLRRRRDL